MEIVGHQCENKPYSFSGTANRDPEIVLNAFKANATRKMKESGCWQSGKTPWVKNGSKRRLWNEQDLMEAILYVEYEQGEPLASV